MSDSVRKCPGWYLKISWNFATESSLLFPSCFERNMKLRDKKGNKERHEWLKYSEKKKCDLELDDISLSFAESIYQTLGDKLRTTSWNLRALWLLICVTDCLWTCYTWKVINSNIKQGNNSVDFRPIYSYHW